MIKTPDVGVYMYNRGSDTRYDWSAATHAKSDGTTLQFFADEHMIIKAPVELSSFVFRWVPFVCRASHATELL